MTRLLVDRRVSWWTTAFCSGSRDRWEIRGAVAELVEGGGLLCSPAVSILEAGFSARSADAHSGIVGRLTNSFGLLALTPEVGLVAVELQAVLWRAGKGRAVGTVDLLHAATAVVHGAVVLHYDSDFEHLAAVDERVRARWVVQSGSIT